MSLFDGYFYDGRSSERRAVTVKLTVPGYLVLQEFGTVSRFPRHELEVLPQIGGQPAIVEIPGGARVEIAAADDFHAAWAQGGGQRQWAHALESSWPTVLVVLLMTLAFGWMVYAKGIPAAARFIANAMPVAIDREIGSEGLSALDDYVFGPSQLTVERQDALRNDLWRVIDTAGGDFDYQLEFRDGKSIGANAFALPSGIIVFTDQLVELAESTAELEAIMAHEVGHVRFRHSLRMLLQSSIAAGLLAVMTGDVAVAGSIAAGLPTMLLRAGYSREFELEADEFARDYLLTAGQDLCAFANIMRRMEKQSEGSVEPPGLLRTHPVTDERVASFCD